MYIFSNQEKAFISNYWGDSFQKNNRFLSMNRFLRIFKENFPQCQANSKEIKKEIENQVYISHETKQVFDSLNTLGKRRKKSNPEIESALNKIAKFHNRALHTSIAMKQKEEEINKKSPSEEYYNSETESDTEVEDNF